MVITRFAVQPSKAPGVITAIQEIIELTMHKGREKNSISFEPGVQSEQTLLNDPPKGCIAGVAVFEPGAHGHDPAHTEPTPAAATDHTPVELTAVKVPN